MLKIIFAIILIFYGKIHLLGFSKAFALVNMPRLKMTPSKTEGILWLLAGLLFIGAGIVCIFSNQWWLMASTALIISQGLIIACWRQARYGTIVNIVVLVATIIGFGTWHFDWRFRHQLDSFQSPKMAQSVSISEKFAQLPPMVQGWLIHSGAKGKPMIEAVHIKQSGLMRPTPQGKWMSFQAEQWFTTDKPGFLWRADVSAAPGIHLYGLDSYYDGKGYMLIKLLGLFPVVNAQGAEIDQGTLMRYLSEIIWFPTAALCDYIQWEPVSLTSARATLNYGGVSASAIFNFNSNGDVVSFLARRFYSRKNGATLENWYIENLPDAYREFESIRIPTSSTVTWKLKEGDYTWLKLSIDDADYSFSGE